MKKNHELFQKEKKRQKAREINEAIQKIEARKKEEKQKITNK